MIVIHPRWEMDEKARIFRSWVWFNPIQPPRAAERMASVASRVGLSEWDVSSRIVIGGSFIIVERRRAVMGDEP